MDSTFDSLPDNTRSQLLEAARCRLKAKIESNLGRVARGDFTPEQLVAAEITDIFLDSDSSFPKVTYTPEELIQMAAAVTSANHEDIEAEEPELRPEVVNSLETIPTEGPKGLGETTAALSDHYDVKMFTETGMSLDAAVDAALGLRQADISFEARYWFAAYDAAKRAGFPVPPLDQFIHDEIDR